MKRTIFVLFLVISMLAALLAGCAAPEKPATEPVTESTAAVSTVPETTEAETEPPEPVYSLLENAQPLGEGMYLTDCPGLDGILYADCYPFCGDLLLVWSEYDENSELPSYGLRRVRLSDGETEAEIIFPDWEYDPPQIYGDRIALCGRDKGKVLLLDEDLQVTDTFLHTPDDGLWYVGSDLSTLYDVKDSTCILAVDLPTGEEQELFRDAGRLFYMNKTDRGLFFTCADPETQLTEAGFLDFYTGTVQILPGAEQFSRISLAGEYWLGNVARDYSIFCFGRGEEDIRLCRDKEQSFTALSDGRIQGGGYGEILLYDEDGKFLSSCHPFEDDRYYLSNSIQPCEAYGGYLFFRFQNDGQSPAQLILWVPEAGQGENLTFLTPEEWEEQRGDYLSDPALYDRAAALSEKYGVRILISEQCPTDFSDFVCEPMTDSVQISYGLDVLENALSIYPENFFSQLAYDTYRTTEICLVGPLTCDSSKGDGAVYAGFSNSSDGQNNIVMDVNLVDESSYHHEISHILDQRLAWDSQLRPEALYSEEGWNALNPEGFSYTESYADYWEEEELPPSDGYFIDAYARISATEDRARVFEYAASGRDDMFRDAPGLQAKLSYYCRCIRDVFDTDGWPEQTAWEMTLALCSQDAVG